MNSKIKKGLRLAAAAIFVFALALNIKITLDDPFVMISEEAVASTTSTTGTSTSPGPCQTQSNLGGQVFPCGNGNDEGETWGTMWCEGTGPEECISGSYYWVLKCDGTQVGSSEQNVSNCN